MTELLLYNGFTPLRRSPADVFLDNGIGLLRAALNQTDIDFAIVDPISLGEIGKFDAPQISAPLRELFRAHLFGDAPLADSKAARLKALYQEMLDSQQQRMTSELERLAQKVAREQIPMVGMKLWAGSTFNYCTWLCKRIHELSPETIIVAGGPQVNCYSFEGEILRLTSFDAAVYSEGEAALVAMVKACRNARTKRERLNAIASARIPNTIYRSEGRIVVSPVKKSDVNRKLIPEYGDMQGRIPVHTIIDALGCDYGKCAFCIHPCIYPHFRKRDPILVVDEMTEMVKKGIGLFSFTASDTPLSHGVKISEEILCRNLRVEFTMLTRAKRNAEQHRDKIIAQFRTLIRAGLKSVFFGVESANDMVLKHVMNKGITADDMAWTMDCLRKASLQEKKWVNIIASFIYPTPLPDILKNDGITHQTIMADNLTFLKRIQPDSFHAIPGLLYPGTEWYMNAAHFNIRFDREQFLKDWISWEFSYHGFVTPNNTNLYSFDDIPLSELVSLAMAFARKGNELGIPSDLWEEQFMFARAIDINGHPPDVSKLRKLSEDLFLDLITGCDRHTRHLYEAAAAHSLRLAQSNRHLFATPS